MTEMWTDALVYWEDLDRPTWPPSGSKYSTVSRFDEDTDWPDKAWSVVLHFDESPHQQGSPSRATVRFLVTDAPQERLVVGAKFSVYEGRTKTATVEIVQP